MIDTRNENENVDADGIYPSCNINEHKQLNEQTTQDESGSDTIQQTVRRINHYPVYIPANIDLAELLRKYPLRLASERVSDKNFQKTMDYIAYFLHIIHAVPAYNKDEGTDNEDNGGYTNLKSFYLQNRIRNYQQVIDWLEEMEIIEVDRQYIVGEKTRGFRFTNTYSTVLKKHYIKTKTLINSLTKRISDEKVPMLQPHHLYGYTGNINNLTYSELAKEMLSFLSYPFNKNLKIDKENAEIYLRQELQKDREIYSELKAMKRFNCRMLIVNLIHDQNFRFHVDDTAGRLHTLLSCLKKELRKFVSYNGNVLTAIDIKTSQPLLSICLLEYDLFVKNSMAYRLSIYDAIASAKAGREFPRNLSIMIGDFLRNNSEAPDIQTYKDLVVSGDIYAFFGGELTARNLIPNHLLPQNGETKIEEEIRLEAYRKYVKREIFLIFFSKNRNVKQDSKASIFRELFPTVFKIFKKIKGGAHNTLACVLQNLEAEIVLHKACVEIHENRPDIPLFTIHDSIVSTTENADFIKGILDKYLRDAVTGDKEPKFKKEDWV